MTKVEPADVIVLIIALVCFVLIIIFNHPPVWGALAAIVVGYLIKNFSWPRKVKMQHDPLAKLESIARQASWFALDNSEKADSIVTAQAALWVLLGRGDTIDEILADPECGMIVGTTRPADDMFMYAEGMLVGKSLKVLIPQRFHENHDLYFAHYSLMPEPRQMGGQRAELPGLRRDGTEFLLEIGLHPKFIRMRRVALATLAKRRD